MTARANQKTAKRAEGLNGLFQLGAFGCVVKGWLADGMAIQEHGENISNEAAKLAESNEKFASSLDRLTEVGPYAGLLTAAMPLVLQLLANHNILPSSAMAAGMGVKDPKVLEAEAKRQLALQAAAAIKAQQAAEADLAEMVQNGELKIDPELLAQMTAQGQG